MFSLVPIESGYGHNLSAVASKVDGGNLLSSNILLRGKTVWLYLDNQGIDESISLENKLLFDLSHFTEAAFSDSRLAGFDLYLTNRGLSHSLGKKPYALAYDYSGESDQLLPLAVISLGDESDNFIKSSSFNALEFAARIPYVGASDQSKVILAFGFFNTRAELSMRGLSLMSTLLCRTGLLESRCS